MAHSGKCTRTAAPAELLCSAAVTPRAALAETAMCRHSNPLPSQSRCCGCQDERGLILSALEQQNALLTELLGAVTGLTAACLCHAKEQS